MSRSILLPILALGGIVLYGTTTASKNSAEAVRPGAALEAPTGERQMIEMEPMAPLVRLPPPVLTDTLAVPTDTLDRAL